jgi:hypothetical protein
MFRLTAAVLAALLLLQIAFPAARAHAQAAAPFPVVPTDPPAKRRHTWAYLTMAGGAALIGFSFVFSDRADEAYADYLVSTDPDEIQLLYDEATRYDRYAQASLLTGEVLIAAGVYLRFIRRTSSNKHLSLTVAPTRCVLALQF